ncbi:MAG: hypothetical protein ACR2O4_01455, partial [Hyphomicrobiaceae bacterium]
RAQRQLGKENTADTNWAGFGNFRAFLTACLPLEFRLTSEPPFLAFEPGRHEPPQADGSSPLGPVVSEASAPAPAAPAPTMNLQESIGRIQVACQAPPLSPPEYRTIFKMIATEINENGLNGAQTLANIGARAQAGQLSIHPTDVRFVLDVVSEADPWFEQGASADLFAGRFRNFVVARCQTQGMSLSNEELELIDAWFAGPAPGSGASSAGLQAPAVPAGSAAHQIAPAPRDPGLPSLNGTAPGYATAESPPGSFGENIADVPSSPQISQAVLGDLADVDVGQLPRIVRSRMRT